MEKMGAPAFGRRPHFLDMGMVHLWPVLWAAHGLCTAVWPIYGLCMTYIWPIYGPTFICGKFGTFTSASVFEHAQVGSGEGNRGENVGNGKGGQIKSNPVPPLGRWWACELSLIHI